MPELTVIDIGAFGGIADGWRTIGSCVNLHAFEANVAECEKLSQESNSDVASLNFYPTAIAGKSGDQTFYHAKSPRCSSLIEPDNAVFEIYASFGTLRNERSRVVKEEMMHVLSLDDFCSTNNIRPDFIKLDTQGNEYQILKDGGAATLENVIGLEIEVEFIKLYKEQALFSDIDLFLRDKGFVLIGLLRNHWKVNDTEHCLSGLPGGRLTYADALFFKEEIFSQKTNKKIAIKSALLLFRYKLWDCTARVLKMNNLTFTDIEKSISPVLAKQYRTLSNTSKSAPEKEVYFDTFYGDGDV